MSATQSIVLELGTPQRPWGRVSQGCLPLGRRVHLKGSRLGWFSRSVLRVEVFLNPTLGQYAACISQHNTDRLDLFSCCQTPMIGTFEAKLWMTPEEDLEIVRSALSLPPRRCIIPTTGMILARDKRAFALSSTSSCFTAMQKNEYQAGGCLSAFRPPVV